MLGLSRPIQPVLLAVCGRDVVSDGMLWRIAGKSVHYASELVVPEPLDAVWRHLTF